VRACVVALVKGFVSNHCATVVQVTNHHFVINKYVQTIVLGTECVPRMASVHVTVDLVVMTVRSHRAAILSAMDMESAKWDDATARVRVFFFSLFFFSSFFEIFLLLTFFFFFFWFRFGTLLPPPTPHFPPP